jgi:hypothetical protein
MKMRIYAISAACLLAGAAAQGQGKPAAEPAQLGALAPANIAKTRPKPPFDLTGTWQHAGGPNNGFRFTPPPDVKLTPAAQAHLDAAQKAAKEGRAYQDDIGHCWPAGLPVIMTRVWPIAMVQTPTEIMMVSGFMNSARFIFLDGRKHTDPDVVVPSFNGESVGHWEKDTLVVDTTGFVGEHHWIDSALPGSEDLHIVERMRLIDGGKTLEIEYTFTDPKYWQGDWKTTKRFKRVDDQDITEASCLPDLNDHMPSLKNSR